MSGTDGVDGPIVIGVGVVCSGMFVTGIGVGVFGCEFE